MTDADQMLKLVIDLGVPEDALDDAVHTCAQEGTLDELNAADDTEAVIGGSEKDASEINNEGFKTQINYLLAHNDVTTVEQIIRDAVKG